MHKTTPCQNHKKPPGEKGEWPDSAAPDRSDNVTHLYRYTKRRQGDRARRLRRQLGLISGALLCGLSGRASAQLLERYEPSGIPGYPDWFTDGVQPTADTGYESLPVKMGTTQVDPALTESAGYDSNVVNSTQPKGSATIETAPAVHAGTDWARNAIDLSLSADDVRYLQAPTESYTAWNASAGGRLDVGDDHGTLAFAHADIFSLPTEIGTFGFFRPVETIIEDGRASYQWQFGKVVLTPSIDIAAYTNSGGGVPIDQVKRDDRIAYTATLALNYEFSGMASAVLIGSDTEARFGFTVPGTPSLNYSDASVLAGIDVHPEGVLRYRALIGYEQLDYSAAGLPNADTPAAELDAVWQPTPLTTLTGRVSRSLQNSPGALDGTYTYTAVHARIDHAYMRNLILDVSADYQSGDFLDGGSHQSLWIASTGATWQLNRGLALALNYSFEAFNVTGLNPRDTTRSVATVKLTLRPGALD